MVKAAGGITYSSNGSEEPEIRRGVSICLRQRQRSVERVVPISDVLQPKKTAHDAGQRHTRCVLLRACACTVQVSIGTEPRGYLLKTKILPKQPRPPLTVQTPPSPDTRRNQVGGRFHRDFLLSHRQSRSIFQLASPEVDVSIKPYCST
jgi:hypothetical protein